MGWWQVYRLSLKCVIEEDCRFLARICINNRQQAEALTKAELWDHTMNFLLFYFSRSNLECRWMDVTVLTISENRDETWYVQYVQGI